MCVMFDGVFNTFLYKKFCIFSYMDEYNISYYNFISLGQLSIVDEIVVAVFLTEEHLPSFELDM